MALYAVLVGTFYKNLSRRDIFRLHLEKYGFQRDAFTALRRFWDVLLYLFKYFFVFPLIVFAYFVVLAAILFFLAKSHSVETILLIALSVVTAVRLTAYYSQEIAVDLAKVLPLALLGVALIDPSFFSVELAQERLNAVPGLARQALGLLAVPIVVEWVLRIFLTLKIVLVGEKRKEKSF
jgi:hypothetical protein